MELFVINRYTGDEPKKEEAPNEQKLRKKLLKKVKERKRLSEVSVDELQVDFKHKKRKKAENFDSVSHKGSTDVNGVCLGDEYEEKVKKKKKKLREAKVNGVAESENEKDVPGENGNEDQAGEKPDGEDNFNEKEKQGTGFTILGDVHMSKKEKVKRKLPNWLANPSVVSVDLKNLTATIDSIPELNEMFVNILKENNISHFFPVQSQIIPWLLRAAKRPHMIWPNDICVSAPTGSGKTLAFVLPILQVLHKRIVPRIRALVVLPVQDLANQVFSVFETYSKPTNLNVLLLSKKRPFEEEQSLICKHDGMGNYRSLVDIIVTTPGRLVDHLTRTKGLCLDNLMYLVIDEADRVMENIQNDWLYHLNKHMNSECTRSYQIPIISYNGMLNRRRPPNKLLFSATLSQDPEKLQQLGLFQPKLFTSVVKSKVADNDTIDETKFIGKYTTPAELTEYYTTCTKANKPLVLHHLVKSKSWKNVLCFVNSAEATSRLAFVLKALSKNAIKVNTLSANLSTRARNRVLQKFSKGRADILVSSDALARGIDIPNVKYVISYDAPRFIKTYIHRIGRTGRAGKEGTSIAFLTLKEVTSFQKMIEAAGKTSVRELEVSEQDIEQYQESYEEALKSLATKLEKRKAKNLFQAKNKRIGKLQASKGKFNKNTKNPRNKRKNKGNSS